MNEQHKRKQTTADALDELRTTNFALLSALAWCNRHRGYVAEQNAYPVVVHRIERGRYAETADNPTPDEGQDDPRHKQEELWCFECLADWYWTVRRIELKRYFGQLYHT